KLSLSVKKSLLTQPEQPYDPVQALESYSTQQQAADSSPDVGPDIQTEPAPDLMPGKTTEPQPGSGQDTGSGDPTDDDSSVETIPDAGPDIGTETTPDVSPDTGMQSDEHFSPGLSQELQ